MKAVAKSMHFWAASTTASPHRASYEAFMLIWRLCRTPFADFQGEGARRYGGRCKSPGRPLVYTASSAALAVLEIRVHLDLPLDLLPDDYMLLKIDVEQGEVERVDSRPAVPSTFGDIWLEEQRTAILGVPSAIVPECTNFLLNPRHPAADIFQVVSQRPFAFDQRLWSTG
jgi:RES domain-containing protein